MDDIKLAPQEEFMNMLTQSLEPLLDVSGIRRKFLNCPYGEDPRQTLDIYLPNEGDGPFPIVFFAHGGAWSRGSKGDMQVMPFIGGVERGYAVVSLDYRLLPNIRYPENLFDIRAALRWIAQNAETYLLDSARSALCGASAGAHLAMMAAFTQGQGAFDDNVGAPTCRILAVVEQFGPTDFAKIHPQFDESGIPRAFKPDDDNVLHALLGVNPERIPNLLRFINPIDNVHPCIPPVLIQHGKNDALVPYQQAVILYEKIISLGAIAELDLREDFMHGDHRYAESESVDRIFGFIDKYLK